MPNRSVLQNFVAANHDHGSCIESALRRAETVCRAQGERLTPLRRQVLELVWGNHRPVKAYDLLDAIAANRRKVAPPTVYRALEFLQSVGLVHKIETMNAFLGCSAPGREHRGQFLICQSCGSAAELDNARLNDEIARTARRLDFTIMSETVEVLGVCGECARAGEQRR